MVLWDRRLRVCEVVEVIDNNMDQWLPLLMITWLGDSYPLVYNWTSRHQRIRTSSRKRVFLQKRPKWVSLPEKVIGPFFLVHVSVKSILIAFRRKEQSMTNITPAYWTGLPTLSRRNIRSWRKIKSRDHTCVLAMRKLNETGEESLSHPPCSPGLDSSDSFLLSNLKRWNHR